MAARQTPRPHSSLNGRWRLRICPKGPVCCGKSGCAHSSFAPLNMIGVRTQPQGGGVLVLLGVEEPEARFRVAHPRPARLVVQLANRHARAAPLLCAACPRVAERAAHRVGAQAEHRLGLVAAGVRYQRCRGIEPRCVPARLSVLRREERACGPGRRNTAGLRDDDVRRAAQPSAPRAACYARSPARRRP